MGHWDTIVCRKGYFDGIVSVYFIRENILRAKTCKDYEQVDPARGY